MRDALSNAERYRLLAEGVPSSCASIRPEFLLHEEGALKVAWAPFDHINAAASVAIVGITPGWQQAEIAYRAAGTALAEGLDYSAACELAKAEASFAGTMRRNLVAMLDEIGVARAMGLRSTEELFGRLHPDVHTTSALRYPVFVSDRNFTGHSLDPMKNEYLRSMVETLLAEELGAISPALVVSLGRAAEECVRHAMRPHSFDVVMLERFPHPSGANGHRTRQFGEERRSLRRAVDASGLTRRSSPPASPAADRRTR